MHKFSIENLVVRKTTGRLVKVNLAILQKHNIFLFLKPPQLHVYVFQMQLITQSKRSAPAYFTNTKWLVLLRVRNVRNAFAV